MKFARRVFLGAGAWGIVVLTPLYFLFDAIGRHFERLTLQRQRNLNQLIEREYWPAAAAGSSPLGDFFGTYRALPVDAGRSC
jgi:hypothetical protein